MVFKSQITVSPMALRGVAGAGVTGAGAGAGAGAAGAGAGAGAAFGCRRVYL